MRRRPCADRVPPCRGRRLRAARRRTRPPAQPIVTVEPARIAVTMFYRGHVHVPPGSRGRRRSPSLLQGEERHLTLKRKGKVLGMVWMNVGDVSFEAVPDVYLLRTSAPVVDLADPTVLERLGMGFRALGRRSRRGAGPDPLFGELARLKERDGLWDVAEGAVTLEPAGDGGRGPRRLLPPRQGNPGEYRVLVYTFERRRAELAGETRVRVTRAGVAALISSSGAAPRAPLRHPGGGGRRGCRTPHGRRLRPRLEGGTDVAMAGAPGAPGAATERDGGEVREKLQRFRGLVEQNDRGPGAHRRRRREARRRVRLRQQVPGRPRGAAQGGRPTRWWRTSTPSPATAIRSFSTRWRPSTSPSRRHWSADWWCPRSPTSSPSPRSASRAPGGRGREDGPAGRGPEPPRVHGAGGIRRHHPRVPRLPARRGPARGGGDPASTLRRRTATASRTRCADPAGDPRGARPAQDRPRHPQGRGPAREARREGPPPRGPLQRYRGGRGAELRRSVRDCAGGPGGWGVRSVAPASWRACTPRRSCATCGDTRCLPAAASWRWACCAWCRFGPAA